MSTVNLDQVGAQSQAAKAQGEAADTNTQATRNLANRLQPMDRELRGAAGNQFGKAAVSNLEGGAALGQRLGELAVSAVLGERAALQGDEEAGQQQNNAVASGEQARSLLNKTITA